MAKLTAMRELQDFCLFCIFVLVKGGTSSDRRKRMVLPLQGKVGAHGVLTTSG